MPIKRHCIEINRELLASVKKAGGFKTNSEAVGAALRNLIEFTEQEAERKREATITRQQQQDEIARGLS